MQDTFLPMSVKDDRVIIYEPYASVISKDFSCEQLSGGAKYICICLKNIQDKTQFLQDIAISIKNMQRDMISKTLKSKAIYSL